MCCPVRPAEMKASPPHARRATGRTPSACGPFMDGVYGEGAGPSHTPSQGQCLVHCQPQDSSKRSSHPQSSCRGCRKPPLEAGWELDSTPSLILQPPPPPQVTSLTPHPAGAPACVSPSLSLLPGAPRIVGDRSGKPCASHRHSAPAMHSNVQKEAHT